MALTEAQMKDLIQGEKVLYVFGGGDSYIKAEAQVVNLDYEIVVITLTKIIEAGDKVDNGKNDTITATPDQLTLIN